MTLVLSTGGSITPHFHSPVIQRRVTNAWFLHKGLRTAQRQLNIAPGAISPSVTPRAKRNITNAIHSAWFSKWLCSSNNFRVSGKQLHYHITAQGINQGEGCRDPAAPREEQWYALPQGCPVVCAKKPTRERFGRMGIPVNQMWRELTLTTAYRRDILTSKHQQNRR